MPQAEASSPHARDLGYLDRFLAKLEAEAQGLPGERGARLKQLLGEEKARWAEISALLGGQEPAPKATATVATPGVPSQPQGPKAASAQTLRAPQGLTVGGLIQS